MWEGRFKGKNQLRHNCHEKETAFIGCFLEE